MYQMYRPIVNSQLLRNYGKKFTNSYIFQYNVLYISAHIFLDVCLYTWLINNQVYMVNIKR